jgi:2-polyprenyl-3-methyl-5-hydroxy-6-metoxy-1,4-benzoquinol methylase
MPDVHRRLRRSPAAIADVACGRGWSSLALATAYPGAVVHGFDLDATAIAAARAGTPPGLASRVSYTVCDVADLATQRSFDLVCVFDSLHDMPRPVEVLAACRKLLGPDGCLLLMEPRADERFTAPAGDAERFLYAVSVLHCLPVGLAGPAPAGTGTVMRPDTVRRYASAAGFGRCSVLPVDHRFHRLYRLDP